MIVVCCRNILLLVAGLLLIGCASEQPTTVTTTSQEDLAAFVEQNPNAAAQAKSVPVPSTVDPDEEETTQTLDLGN